MQNLFQIQRLPENLAYLIYSSNQLETLLDLLLVSMTYFLILLVIRRSQAAVLLRGVLIIALIAVAVSALFQLPTFTWMLRTALILCLVATPLIFQPELRRGLERLGRTLGFLQIRPTELSHRVVPALVRVASDLSERQIGALIILEGTTALSDVISTEVQLNAHLSPDLLETIFQNKSPLHDGAVVIREDEIVAAAAVLPLSEQPLPEGMHQGTRHRAALGISEQSDSLALVVSEENGFISVAQNGRLNRDLDATELRDTLYRFYIPLRASSSGVRGLFTAKFSKSGRNGKVSRRTRMAQILRFVATVVLAVMLAVATWLLVAEQVNPAKTEVMTDIPLRLSNQDKELLLVSNLPTTVSAVVQAPQDLMANLSAQSFRANADLSGLSADVHRVPVDVRANDERVRVVSVDPTAIDVELQLKATRPMTVEVVVSDRDTLPFSYEINGNPSAQPSQVTVTGPADVMENLARTEVVIPLRGARSTVQEDRTVLFKDAQGQALTGLTADPEIVQVTVPISQSFNTRDAAVHVVITGTVAPGYWISNIAVDPNTVTLLGPQAILEQIGGFVDTIPVDVSDAAGDILRRVPLAPPARVSALNERGVSEASVETRITIVPQLGNLRLTVPVELNGAQPTDTVSKSPASVDVLLSGPLPVLNQINADPKLVRVVVDVTDLGSGTYDVTPTLIVPESLKATLVPGTVQIRLVRPETTLTPAPTAIPRRP